MRHDAPERDHHARYRGAHHGAGVPQAMEAHELTGPVAELRGRDHIHHDVDESTGRERER